MKPRDDNGIDSADACAYGDHVRGERKGEDAIRARRERLAQLGERVLEILADTRPLERYMTADGWSLHAPGFGEATTPLLNVIGAPLEDEIEAARCTWRDQRINFAARALGLLPAPGAEETDRG